MHLYADLHIHSRYSRSTSSLLNPENLLTWACKKGLHIVGTGDCVHPGWFSELREKLTEDGSGLLSLKDDCKSHLNLPCSYSHDVRFMLTGEISCIYKRDGKVRKVHNLVCLPSFKSAEKFAAKLDRIGNIRSDGRPIFGLDSRDLLSLLLDSDPDALLIPAHIWTPWFSVLGSESGFNSIEECFGHLTADIHAVETGLSSDPAMNWRLSSLDKFALVSNSDAHSPSKLGRECTIFNTDCTYDAIRQAIVDPSSERLSGTIEFFPEEGKYHFDGHRKCGVRCAPGETRALGGLCPKCGKPLTVGVMARVEQLADRNVGEKPRRTRPFHNLIPLQEIIAQALGTGPETTGVIHLYDQILVRCGNELAVLRDVELDQIALAAGELVAEGVRRVRCGEVSIAAGYDGDFGEVMLFKPEERAVVEGQTAFFQNTAPRPAEERELVTMPDSGLPSKREPMLPLSQPDDTAPDVDALPRVVRSRQSLNEAQAAAVFYKGTHLLIIAGPGTGKTHTLTRRIAFVARHIEQQKRILALAFTVKAAQEMREGVCRIDPELSGRIDTETIHSFCLDLLRTFEDRSGLPTGFKIATYDELSAVSRKLWPELTKSETRDTLNGIAVQKCGLSARGAPDIERYNNALGEIHRIDSDDLLRGAYTLLSSHRDILESVRTKYGRIFIDEYQDINAIQHAIIKLLGSHIPVAAIGDPDQAIYGFRGADIRFFNCFTKDFHGAAVLSLKQNYRNPATLITAGMQLMRNARKSSQAHPLVPTVKAVGHLIVHNALSDRSEAEYVAHQIEQLVGGTSMFSHDSGRLTEGDEGDYSFGDIAVLYRLNSKSRFLEEALDRCGIPVQIATDRPLHSLTPVSQLVQCIKLISGEMATVQVICGLLESCIEGFAPRSSALALERLGSSGMFRLEDLRANKFLEDIPVIREALFSLSRILEMFSTISSREGMRDGLLYLSSISPWSRIEEQSSKVRQAWERVLRVSALSSSLQSFHDALVMDKPEDAVNSGCEKVSLLTMHASKGLEWPVVFIIGCEDGVIPLMQPGKQGNIDEERRLLYVAMTRAKRLLFLTYPIHRLDYGIDSDCRPSRFLSSINEQLKEYDKTRYEPARQSKPDAEQLSFL